MINSFSIDLEDWYQAVTSINPQRENWHHYLPRIEQNTFRLLAILEDYKIKATFFVLGYVADRYPDLIKKIDAAGHEIGVHGYWHVMVHKLSPELFSEELDRSLKTLRSLVSQPVIGHRAPYFSINQKTLWALDILWEKGFRYDSSFYATRNMLYGYPNSPRFPHKPGDNDLMEFPLATARWGGINWPIGGGFTLRLFPYSLIEKGILQINQAGKPAVLYMHPWELDIKHRYNRVKPREWIVQYFGRAKLEMKLRRLFNSFEFVPICALLE